MTRTADIQVGILVRYRYGGEAWAFTKTTEREKAWKVLAIRIVQAPNGVAHSVWLQLEGREAEVGLIDVEGIAA